MTITVSNTAPTSGFYIQQWNEYGGSPADVYIYGTQTFVPEPSSWLQWVRWTMAGTWRWVQLMA